MSTIYDNMGNGSEDKSALDEVFGRSADKYEEIKKRRFRNACAAGYRNLSLGSA